MKKYSEKELLDLKDIDSIFRIGGAGQENTFRRMVPNLIDEILSLRHEIEMAQKLMKHQGIEIQESSPWYQQMYLGFKRRDLL